MSKLAKYPLTPKVLSNVVVTPMKSSQYGQLRTTAVNSTTSQSQAHKITLRSPQGVKTAKSHTISNSIISKLPLPRKASGGLAQQSGMATTAVSANDNATAASGAGGSNDNAIIMDIDSPYSPGSSDFDDLFEPPSSTTDTYKPVTGHKQANVTSTSNRGTGLTAGKLDLFDNLFGSTSPTHKFSNVTSTYKTKKRIRKRELTVFHFFFSFVKVEGCSSKR